MKIVIKTRYLQKMVSKIHVYISVQWYISSFEFYSKLNKLDLKTVVNNEKQWKYKIKR